MSRSRSLVRRRQNVEDRSDPHHEPTLRRGSRRSRRSRPRRRGTSPPPEAAYADDRMRPDHPRAGELGLQATCLSADRLGEVLTEDRAGAQAIAIAAAVTIATNAALALVASKVRPR